MTITGTPDVRGLPGRSLPIDGGSTPPPSQEFIPGTLGERLAAKLIDLAIIKATPVILVIGMLFSGDLHARLVTTGWSEVLGATFVFVYFVASEAIGGRTLGKRLMGLRVYGPGGSAKPTFMQAVARNAYLLLWLLPVFFNLPLVLVGVGGILFAAAAIAIAISIHRSPTHRGINDRMAGGTQVINL